MWRGLYLLVCAGVVWASTSVEPSLVHDFVGVRVVIQFTRSCTAPGYGDTARLLSPDVQFNVVSCGSCKPPPLADGSRKIFLWDAGDCDAVSLMGVMMEIGASDMVFDDLEPAGFTDERRVTFAVMWPFVSPGGAYVLASQSELLKMAMDGVRCAAPCESPVLKCTSQACTLRKFTTSEPPFNNVFDLRPGSKAEKMSAQFWATELPFVSKFWPARHCTSADEPTAPMVYAPVSAPVAAGCARRWVCAPRPQLARLLASTARQPPLPPLPYPCLPPLLPPHHPSTACLLCIAARRPTSTAPSHYHHAPPCPFP
jgi:hypothetical protein